MTKGEILKQEGLALKKIKLTDPNAYWKHLETLRIKL